MKYKIFRMLLKHVSDSLSVLFQFAGLYFQCYSWGEYSCILRWNIRLHHERWLWWCSGHSFVSEFLKLIWNIVIYFFVFFFVFEFPSLKMFLIVVICSPICSYKGCSYKSGVYNNRIMRPSEAAVPWCSSK